MADGSTTHYNLVKQDSNAAPDNSKTNGNWDTLDTTIYGIDSEAVKVSEQTLTDAQKAQAIENIGAVSVDEQTLTDEQQEQVRTNIGAYPAEYIIYSSTEPTEGLVEGMIWLKPRGN